MDPCCMSIYHRHYLNNNFIFYSLLVKAMILQTGAYLSRCQDIANSIKNYLRTSHKKFVVINNWYTIPHLNSSLVQCTACVNQM